MTTKINVLQVMPKLGYGAETGCYDLAHYLAEQECNHIFIQEANYLNL